MAYTAGQYCTLDEVKELLKIPVTNTNSDALLRKLIIDGSAAIDSFCQRRFYGVVETRYYNAQEDASSNFLYLDEDLAGVISITLGDGTTLSPSDYVFEPTNTSPKHAIRLKISAGKYWQQFIVDPENAITVEGTWGYVAGNTPPAQVNRACLEYVRYRYLGKRAPQPSGQTGTQGLGEQTVATTLPDDIKSTLLPYRAFRIKGVGA